MIKIYVCLAEVPPHRKCRPGQPPFCVCYWLLVHHL